MVKELNIPSRILMGPGPSDVDPRVLKAMATPMIGHMDPKFMTVMDEVMQLLRYVFQTENELTVAMSGTGSAGMETVFVNLLDPGDQVIVGVNGLFGERMVDVAERCGAEVIQIHANWGDVFTQEQIETALKNNPDVKFVALVHAETSTGALQPLEGLADIVHAHDALLILDAVTSLGGSPIKIDEMKVDACYSGTQKCLSAPPGLAPVTFSKRALDVMENKKNKVQSWYLDLSMIRDYWGSERAYHHTAPISMNYALHESLRIIKEEGLENAFERHERLGKALHAGLEEMGLELHVDEKYRLPQLTAVRVPEGVNEAEVRQELLNNYSIEVGAGLGALKGKIWRIGLMGCSCKETNVVTLLGALEQILKDKGAKIRLGVAIEAATKVMFHKKVNE